MFVLQRDKATKLIGIGLLAASLWMAALGAAPVFGQEIAPPSTGALVAVSPTHPAAALAAVDATVLRTVDGGATWQVAGELPSPVRSLAVTAGEEAVVVAGVATSGIYRSFDGGETWQAVNEGVGLMPGVIVEVNALGVDPQDPRIVYAATGYQLGTSTVRFSPTALLVSVDSGATWLPLAALPLNSPRFTSLTAVPGQPLTVQAQAADGAATLYSVDGAQLAELMQSPEASAARQAAAARALGLLDDADAVPALVAAAQGADPTVASAAVEALGALRAEAAIPALAGLLERPAAASPSAVANALAAIGDAEALAPLYQALETDDVTPTRHAAMGALEGLGSAAVPGLLELAAGADTTAQRNAVEMLGWIADPASLDGLAAALDASEPAVRSQAAWALGELLAAEKLPADAAVAAQQALATAAFADLSPDVRLHATQALARLPQPAVGPLAVAGDEATPAGVNGQSPVASRNSLPVPGWLAALAPALRWAVLLAALAAIVALPWLQNLRDFRRRRRH